MRLVRVGIGQLTVEELEEMAAHLNATDPEHAAELRRGKDWKTEHPFVPPPEAGGGPGVIALGVSIGSGEFLLGPAAFVQHGLSLLWVVIMAAVQDAARQSRRNGSRDH